MTGIDTGALTTSKFGTVDLTTGVYTQISANTGGGYANLTYRPSSGLLYTSTTAGTGGLYTVNSATGNTTLVGDMGFDAWAMAMSDTEEIFAYNWASDTLNWVDPSDASPTFVANASTYAMRPPQYGSFEFVGSTLYTSANWQGAGIFGTVDTSTGNVSQIAIDEAYKSLKLAYDGTTLYALDLSNIYTVDPTNGTLSNPVSITGSNWFTAEIYGASFAIPEPGTLSMLALAVGIVGITRRRHQKPGQGWQKLLE